MNEKRSMRIFWISLCLLLLSGAVIIAVVQYRTHKKNESEGLGGVQKEQVQARRPEESSAQDGQDRGSGSAQTENPYYGKDPAVSDDSLRPASSTAAEYEFELKVTDGYLDVYYYKTKELYFHTGIPESALTQKQKQELSNGRYFLSEQELYGYLESCTS